MCHHYDRPIQWDERDEASEETDEEEERSTPDEFEEEREVEVELLTDGGGDA